MPRNLVLTIVILLLGSQSALARDWAKEMFKETNHDFGSVAKSSKTEFTFKFTNKWKETVHISDVRASCGCVTPTVLNETVESLESGVIKAKFNTDRFDGQKSATITVSFDEPFYTEVQLTIKGYIRTDVVFNPGVINFGEVEFGTASEQNVAVEYAGRGDWRILDVRSANPHFEVSLKESKRGGGRVGYNMHVRLKPDAPAGFFSDQLSLITDDNRLKRIPLSIEGVVISPLSISPASLFMGVLSPGETATKKLIIRSTKKKPFKVLDIQCSDKNFQFELSDKSQTIHIIPVKYTAGKDGSANISQVIEVKTDLANGADSNITASVKIKEPVAKEVSETQSETADQE